MIIASKPFFTVFQLTTTPKVEPVDAGAEMLPPRLHTVPGEHAHTLLPPGLTDAGQGLDLPALPRLPGAGHGDILGGWRGVLYPHHLGVLSGSGGRGERDESQHQDGGCRHPHGRTWATKEVVCLHWSSDQPVLAPVMAGLCLYIVGAGEGACLCVWVSHWGVLALPPILLLKQSCTVSGDVTTTSGPSRLRTPV